jgi:hypothetical protein
MLRVELDNGVPTGVFIDDKPVFVEAMDIKFRSCQPALITIQVYSDHPHSMSLSSMVYYAVSKEDYELLKKVKAE